MNTVMNMNTCMKINIFKKMKMAAGIYTTAAAQVIMDMSGYYKEELLIWKRSE